MVLYLILVEDDYFGESLPKAFQEAGGKEVDKSPFSWWASSGIRKEKGEEVVERGKESCSFSFSAAFPPGHDHNHLSLFPHESAKKQEQTDALI